MSIKRLVAREWLIFLATVVSTLLVLFFIMVPYQQSFEYLGEKEPYLIALSIYLLVLFVRLTTWALQTVGLVKYSKWAGIIVGIVKWTGIIVSIVLVTLFLGVVFYGVNKQCFDLANQQRSEKRATLASLYNCSEGGRLLQSLCLNDLAKENKEVKKLLDQINTSFEEQTKFCF